MTKDALDIIIPISLDLDWPTYEALLDEIMELYRDYGFRRFALSAPGGGWRAVGFPPKAFYEEKARLFRRVKEALSPCGIECGWWITATLKSGKAEGFTGYVNAGGGESPFQNCPLDTVFRERFVQMTALFAESAKPAFILTEDDYTLVTGCFCRHHLEAFACREGKYRSRAELLAAFSSGTDEGYALLRRWRELVRDSLVLFAEEVRAEVDKKSPEIPIGYMQAGWADFEGDSTEAIAMALAGPRHTPFSRINGITYCGIETKDIPEIMFNPLHTRQYIKGDFPFYHKSDTYPHTRFFTEGVQMKAIMSVAYSYGYGGSTFNAQQQLDAPNEEKTFIAMFRQDRERFNAVFRAVKNCRMRGVEICCDPFWNTVGENRTPDLAKPLWIRCLSLFGIPYTTEEAEIAFWDVRQAEHADDETVRKYLAKGLFVDGDAAKALCQWGFGEYLGVEIGDDVAVLPLCYDLGAREIICEKFRAGGRGKNMPSAHMYSVDRNGKLLRMTVTDPGVEVISEEYDYLGELLSPAMTRFVNRLGGRVVVLGSTLRNNRSQCLYNYRRKRLFEQMLMWCGDCTLFVREEPNLFTVVNKAENAGEQGFRGIVTLLNLGADSIHGVTLHLPEKWTDAKAFYLPGRNAEWERAECTKEGQELTVHTEFRYCEPVYLKIQ